MLLDLLPVTITDILIVTRNRPACARPPYDSDVKQQGKLLKAHPKQWDQRDLDGREAGHHVQRTPHS